MDRQTDMEKEGQSSGLPPVAKPFVRGIETTNMCQGYCHFCPYDQMTRPKGFIDDTVFRLAIENVISFSREEIITLHHFGDPLLHPKLPELINYAGAKGLKTKISTIGAALTPWLIESLASSALTVLKFSFWGCNQQEFEAYQKVSYRRTMDNINTFITKNKKVNVIIEILSNGKQDITRLEYYDKWKHLLQIKRIGPWTGDIDRINIFTSCSPLPQMTSKPCGKFWKSELKILWNGDVVPCCMDYDGKAVIGSIKERTIMDIWHSKTMNHFRQLNWQGKKSEMRLCRFCGGTNFKQIGRDELLR